MARPSENRRDDWHDRHARTAGHGREASGTVRISKPVWERNWHARHGHVARLDRE